MVISSLCFATSRSPLLVGTPGSRNWWPLGGHHMNDTKHSNWWSWNPSDRDKRPEQLQHLKHEQRTLCSLSGSQRKHQGNPLPRQFRNRNGFRAWEWTTRAQLVDVDLQWNANQCHLSVFCALISCWGTEKRTQMFYRGTKHWSAFTSLLFGDDHLHRQIGFGVSTIWTAAPAAYITGAKLREGLRGSGKSVQLMAPTNFGSCVVTTAPPPARVTH